MKLLVTGSSGFIGSALVKALENSSYFVLSAKRGHAESNHEVAVDHIDGHTDWTQALTGCEVVVHLAARAHVTKDEAIDPMAVYRSINAEGTYNLAIQAAQAGVRRFVFISTIGVNGIRSEFPFTETNIAQPQGAYAISKYEAELALLGLAEQACMEVVIIRPPLVYGPNAPGNFGSLVRLVLSGLPLPLGAVHNQRSLVALDNLISMIILCADPIRSPLAANQVFLVSDGEDVSITTLLGKIAKAADRPSRLLPVPIWLLGLVASLMGKRAVADRLLGNLQIDVTKARTLLGWQPVVTMDDQLADIFAMSAGPRVANNCRQSIRIFDVVFSAAGLLLLCPVLLLVFIVSWFDTRSPLFTQERVGLHQQPFVLVKFRTMSPGTPHVASHLASSASITRLGALLRRTKLDELPQLWNVLLGHMSLVGPRPGLFDQHELTTARAARGVYTSRPGITGLAQVSGINMSTPELLAQTDAQMLSELTLRNYFKFILLTVLGRGLGDGVNKF